MTIGKKLYISFSFAAAIALVACGMGLFNVDRLGETLSTSTKCLYLSAMVDNFGSDALAQVRGELMMAHLHKADGVELAYKTFLEDLDIIKKDNDEFIDTTKSAELKDKALRTIEQQIDPVRTFAQSIHSQILKGDLAAADQTYLSGASLVETFSSAGDYIAQSEMKLVEKREENAKSIVGSARVLSFSLILLALGVGAVVVWVVRGINTLLRSSIVELNDGAEQVATAAGQVSSSSQSLAQGASQQAASLEETSASSEEINSMARRNTDNSRSTAQLLAQSQSKVNQANGYLEEMVVSMGLITDSSGKISKIIKVIDEIAFQTNILALNAAVEAARAGEAGMGFAVVADEVRSLAQRSAQAAKDTATLIEDSITRSNEGKLKVDQVALAIRTVTEDSAKVKVMVDEVSLGSEEQSRGIDQIGRSISQMEQVTQTNAASAEESAAAAEELSAQSETLKDVIGRLQEMIGGSEHASSVSLHTTRRPQRASSSYRPRVSVPQGSSMKGQAGSSNQGGGATATIKRSGARGDSFPIEENCQSF